MQDWEKCVADKTMLMKKHYSKGQPGRKIRKIVLHHNAGNLTIENCYNVWQTREASAHYQVQSDGVIGQLVYDCDIAWHAGDWNANLDSIGIEHADESSSPWRISEKCLDNGAHLVAALCKLYGLGKPQWRVNVLPHSAFCATSCPCSLRDSQNTEYMRRAQQWYETMVHGTPAPTAPQKQPAPTPQTKSTPKPAPKPATSPIVKDGDISGFNMHIPWGTNDGQIMHFTRCGNVVTVNGCGYIKCGGGQWLKAGEHVPEGFRPVSLSTIHLSGDGTGSLMVKEDGSIYWDGTRKENFTHVSGVWITKDNQPK